MRNEYREIILFWFDEIEPADWWRKNEDFDAMLCERFSEFHARASRCELYTWRDEPQGRLAEIIILDQFSRNMFRNSPLAFANDALALALAQEAIAGGGDQALEPIQRSFMYLPYMHSESLEIHEVAVGLYRDNGIANNLEFEHKHKRIIERFGRYPHRNAVLGRRSTEAELEFLKQPGSGF